MVEEVHTTLQIHMEGPSDCSAKGMCYDESGQEIKLPSLYGGRFYPSPEENQEAAAFFWDLAQRFPEAVVSWTHDGDKEKYTRKMVLHVPGLTTSFPSWGETEAAWIRARLQGTDTVASFKKARRDTNLVFPKVGPPVLRRDFKKAKGTAMQSSEREFLLKYLMRWQTKLPVEARSAEPVWDLTVAWSTSVIPQHADEWEYDGHSPYIGNECHAANGLLTYKAHPEGWDAGPENLLGLYVAANQFTIFADELRFEAQHQVLRLEPKPVPLKMKATAPQKTARCVATYRCGKPTRKQEANYKMCFGADTQAHVEETETSLRLEAAQAKIEKLEAKSKSLSKRQREDNKKLQANAKADAEKVTRLSKRLKEKENELVEFKSRTTAAKTPQRAVEVDLTSDGSDTGEQVFTSKKFKWTGPEEPLCQGCPSHVRKYTSLSLRCDERSILKPGQTFSTRSRKGPKIANDYLLVRIGVINLGSDPHHAVWAVAREALGDWGPVFQLEPNWLLNGDPYITPLFTKATKEDIAVGEERFADYIDQRNQVFSRPSGRRRNSFLLTSTKALEPGPGATTQPVHPVAPETATGTAICFPTTFAVQTPMAATGTPAASSPPHQGVLGEAYSVYNRAVSQAQGGMAFAFDAVAAHTAAVTKEMVQEKHKQELARAQEEIKLLYREQLKTQAETLSITLGALVEGRTTKSSTATPGEKRSRADEPVVTEQDLAMGIRLLLESNGRKAAANLGLKKLQKFASSDQAQELQEIFDVIVSEEGSLDRDLYTDAILVPAFVSHCMSPVDCPSLNSS